MKRTMISLAVCIAILSGGAGIIAWSVASHQQAAQQEDPIPPERRVSVLTAPVERTLVEDHLTVTGTVLPWLDVTISSESRGSIEWRQVEEGQTVRKGDTLLRVDTDLIRARLDQVKAEATLAQQEYDRAQSLSQRGVSAARDLDSAVARLNVAQANLRSLQIELEKSVVTAPFDGVIDTLFHEEQEFIDVGAPVVRLVQTENVKIVVGVPERDISYFAVDDGVHVRIDALPGEQLEGVIHRIATTADMSTHTFTTEVALPNPDGRIRPGMIARASFIRKAYPDSILAPIFSTFLLEDQRYVFVVVNGKARLRPVESGIVQGGYVQILNGLDTGDALIVRGQYEVQDGDPVQTPTAADRDSPR